jgi:hypothetical protein
MSETPTTTPTGGPADAPAARTPSATWQGWAYFGAVVMGLLGFFQALLGLIALMDQEFFALRENALLAASSYATWGWVHLLGGAAAFAVGIAIVATGHTWARRAGVVIAGLSAVINLGYLAASPVWSTLIITLAVLVIYALTVHGSEIDNR